MSDKPAMAKDGTMVATAKEGIQYLKDNQKDFLLKMQGLDGGGDSAKPALAKDGTMIITSKEGQEFVESKGGVDTDAKTRGQQEMIDSLNSASHEGEEPSPKKPRLSQHTTIKATTDEAAGILGAKKLGDTRSETKLLTPDAKPAVARAGTMAQTAQEGEEWLERCDGESTEAEKPGMKKAGTMQQTAQEGAEWLTRGKGDKPDMNRDGTMDKTAKEGAEWLERK